MSKTKDYGWLDTNIFIHPLYANDSNRKRCEKILEDIRSEEATGWVSPLVVHELTYILPQTSERFRNKAGKPERKEIFEFLSSLLALENIKAEDKDLLLETLLTWTEENIAFTDARLKVKARQTEKTVCSANKKDFSPDNNSF